MFSSIRMPSIANAILPVCLGFALFVAIGSAQGQTKKGQAKEDSKQDPNAPVIVQGKIVSISKKGRSNILKVEANGEQKEFILNSKVDFSVQGKGNKDFLATGQFIQTMATPSNDQLFSTEIFVIAKKGRKPKGGITKAPMKAGISKNAWVISGSVSSVGQHPDYEKYDRMQLKAGSKKLEILMEKGYRVTVVTDDMKLVKEGAAIELEGRPGRGGRFSLARATVKLNETFKAEDFIKKKKTSRKRTSRSKKSSKGSKSPQDSKSDKDSKTKKKSDKDSKKK